MKQDIISSVQNPQVKHWYSLQSKKGREEAGSFLVEGAHLVEEALKSNADVAAVIYDAERGLPAECERAMQELQYPIKRIAVSPQVMHKISETKTPQGVLAEIRKAKDSWGDFWRRNAHKQDLLLLILDEIQDPGNLGTILRTADAAGADAVILGEGSVDLYNGKVVRATMGSLFRIPVFSQPIAEVAEQLKQAGGKLLATTLAANSQPYTNSLYAGKCGIVIGNEGRGVSPAVLACADQLVHIPLYGGAESLNAAVAAGIMLFEAQRQRNKA